MDFLKNTKVYTYAMKSEISKHLIFYIYINTSIFVFKLQCEKHNYLPRKITKLVHEI